MSDTIDSKIGTPQTGPGPARVLGRVGGTKPGPTVVVTAGIHGNEWAGVQAARRVLDSLEARGTELRGTLCVLAGNLPALVQQVRFIDLDLNRQWSAATVAALDANPAVDGEPAEYVQMRELLASLRAEAQRAQGELYFLDLHTSSADGPPFVTVGDTLRNRRFARHLPLPLILGLEEQVDGALLEFLNDFGFVTMGVEAGSHEADSSVDRHECVLWLALMYAGVLDETDLPHPTRCRDLLRTASRGAPSVVEVRHRHEIFPDDGFHMGAGFVNFQPIRRGQSVARDARGPIESPEDGLMLLPLYQGQGDDGFFVARAVRPSWLRVSRVVRRLRLGSIVHLLPGVRRLPGDESTLRVDTRVARIFPLQVFHLLGYRKLRQDGDELLVSRRRHDVIGPRRISL